MNKFIQRLGTTGYSLNNYGNTAMCSLTNGTFLTGPDSTWFNGYYQLPAGAALWWNNQPNPGGEVSDQAGLFYVAQPLGGGFHLSVSTNGGPWSRLLALDGYSPSPIGRYTNIALAQNRYRLRVDGDSGMNDIIGPQVLLTHTSGVHAVFMDWPGISLGEVTNVPASIREPIFAALRPNLLIWHMKEDGSVSTSNRMSQCETWWANAFPACDVVYIGTTWVFYDTNSNLTLEQNSLVRNIALKYHRAYADLMQPTVSYTWLTTNGYFLDGVHLNSAGGLRGANIMWDDLGFFALGLDRRLLLAPAVAPAAQQLQLTYHTATGAVYSLDVSTNRLSWRAVCTNPVAAATVTTNLPPAPSAQFFRLRLKPL